MTPVFARASSTVALPHGGVVAVMEGTHWSEDDPIVKAHPELFSHDARYGALFSRPLEPEDYPGAEVPESRSTVEQATATPGDLRNINRGHRRG
jgi:hypothetical protein